MIKRVIFCHNQVSLCVAVSLAEKDSSTYSKTTIFYSPARCDASVFKYTNALMIEYSGLRLLRFLAKEFFLPPDEVCMPHLKGENKFINWYARYAKRLSLIDDGLDTFRNVPNNVVISDFEPGSYYYTFNYDFPLADWLSEFTLIKECPVAYMACSSKQLTDLNIYDCIIIESPGVDASVLEKCANKNKLLLIRHSNPQKNTIANPACSSVQGDSFALEGSLATYKKRLIVGESMVAVYCLLVESPKFELQVSVKKENLNNMKPLVNLIVSSKHTELL